MPRETAHGERRVALVPQEAEALQRDGHEVLVEYDACLAAGFPDAQYESRGVRLGFRAEMFDADVVAQVRTPGAHPADSAADVDALRAGGVLVGLGDPLGCPSVAQAVAAKGVTSFALELLPRITRAQAMDVLAGGAGWIQGGAARRRAT